MNKPHFLLIDHETDLIYSTDRRQWYFVNYTKKGTKISQDFNSKIKAFLAYAKDTIQWSDVLDN